MKKSVGIVLGVFAVIAALMMGIGVGSYFDKDKNNNNEIDKIGENDNKSEEKVLDVNSTLVKALIGGALNAGFTNNLVNDDYFQYIYKNDKLIIDSTPLEFKLSLAARNLNLNEKYSDGKVTGYVYESDLKDAYEKIFGSGSYKSGKYFYPNTGSLCAEYKYNQSSKRYEMNASDCGTGSDVFNLTKVTKAVEKEDSIELYENILFCEYTINSACYSDVAKTNKIGNIAVDVTNDDFLNANIASSGQYKYTFTKNNNDQYVFTSVERVK